MSAAYVVCPHCHAGNPWNATVCWMCRSALAPGPAPTEQMLAVTPAPAPGQASPPRRSPIGWSITLAISVLLSCAITFELARVAPGLLIVFLFVDLPVVGALFVTVLKMLASGAPAKAAPGSGQPSGGEPQSDAQVARQVAVTAVTGVAVGLGALFTLLAVIVLFVFAIVVITTIICVAVILVSQHP